MTSVDFAQDAADKALLLVSRECRGAGDTEKAMRRVADRIGVPYSQLYSLRYRTPRDISTNIYFRIFIAYERETARSASSSRHDRDNTQARTWAGRALLRLADALDRGADALAAEEAEPVDQATLCPAPAPVTNSRSSRPAEEKTHG